MGKEENSNDERLRRYFPAGVDRFAQSFGLSASTDPSSIHCAHSPTSGYHIYTYTHMHTLIHVHLFLIYPYPHLPKK